LKEAVTLSIALILLVFGWAGAFLLANNPPTSQSYWLIPAVIIGVGVGLCLRYVSGRRTALILTLTAALGLGAVNRFFPDSRVSVEAVRNLFSGGDSRRNLRPLKVDERFQSAPFDQPMILTSPVSLDISLFTRLPAGVDDFCFSSAGTLYASLPELGAVYRVAQAAEGRAGKPELFLHGLDQPTGLACDSTRLLVAEISRIGAYPYTGESKKLLVEGLPDDGGELDHRLQLTPEGLLFSIGARCDACNEKNPLRATVQLLAPDGRRHLYAGGLRDVGGLTFDTATGGIWASERSRLYPEPGAGDELNRLRAGEDYGWPACESGAADSSSDSRCQESIPAETLLRNRANPAGLMTTAMLNYPLVYRNSLLLVLQGDSAKRIVPAVVRLQLSEGKVGAPVAFLGGWDGKTARPSAIHAGPDGALFIADDLNGAIYRAVWRRPD
jgi:glucose/arabinose dehydrogenase